MLNVTLYTKNGPKEIVVSEISEDVARFFVEKEAKISMEEMPDGSGQAVLYGRLPEWHEDEEIAVIVDMDTTSCESGFEILKDAVLEFEGIAE